MSPVLLLLSCLVVVHGLVPGKEGCVDVSRYEEVTYSALNETVCGHRVERTCTPQQQRVCTTVPQTVCSLELGSDCSSQGETVTQRCDTSEERLFTPKQCQIDEIKLLNETKQMPVCEPVTKQVCDSKWVINEDGEKVWDGNQNCREVTWEDCKLVERVVSEEVPTYSCQDDTAIPYIAPVVREEQVTYNTRTCAVVGGSVCTVSHVQECTTVEWTDCVETVVSECQEVTVRMPEQTRNHLLRCTVDH